MTECSSLDFDIAGSVSADESAEEDSEAKDNAGSHKNVTRTGREIKQPLYLKEFLLK